MGVAPSAMAHLKIVAHAHDKIPWYLARDAGRDCVEDFAQLLAVGPGLKGCAYLRGNGHEPLYLNIG